MKKLLLLFTLLVLSIACISSGANQSTSEKETIVVKSGELRETIKSYSGEINKNTIINVYKSDGTLDGREDDLKELCLDFNYYQNQIIKHEASGNSSKAADARALWNQVNNWLDEYDYDDIAYMFTLIEDKGW